MINNSYVDSELTGKIIGCPSLHFKRLMKPKYKL